ncbi:hypothetical protein CFRS1_v015699 [Colletotrichum fructicola]|nr:hypothetical protein CFRS1_v015699 [Colletotrichum fructicola]
MSLCDELHDGANRPASANSRHGLFSGPHIYLNDSYVGSDERALKGSEDRIRKLLIPDMLYASSSPSSESKH